jgi:hypothetical protein
VHVARLLLTDEMWHRAIVVGGRMAGRWRIRFHARMAVGTAVAIGIHAAVFGIVYLCVDRVRPGEVAVGGAGFWLLAAWCAIGAVFRRAAGRAPAGAPRATLAGFAAAGTYPVVVIVWFLAPSAWISTWYLATTLLILPPLVAGVALGARRDPEAARVVSAPRATTAVAPSVFRRRLRRGLALGVALHVVVIAIGRAYLMWYESAHPYFSSGPNSGVSYDFDWNLAAWTWLVVPASYAIGLALVFAMIRRAEQGYIFRQNRLTIAVVVAVLSTVAAVAAMPSALDAGIVARSTWVIAALLGPPLLIGICYLIGPTPFVATVGRPPASFGRGW